MVCRNELTSDETVDILDVKNFGATTVGYTLASGLYPISDLNLMIKYLLPKKPEIKTTTDDIRFRSTLATNKLI